MKRIGIFFLLLGCLGLLSVQAQASELTLDLESFETAIYCAGGGHSTGGDCGSDPACGPAGCSDPNCGGSCKKAPAKDACKDPNCGTDPCALVKLNALQKATIEHKVKVLKAQMKTLSERIQKAEMAYMMTIENKSANIIHADRVAESLSDRVTDLVDATLSFRNDILFNVVDADQRMPMLKCIQHKIGAKKKSKKIKKKKSKCDTGKCNKGHSH